MNKTQLDESTGLERPISTTPNRRSAVADKAQHSPLPWSIDPEGEYETAIESANGKVVCSASDQDAKLIVRAVNGFSEALAKAEYADKLAEALRDFIKVVRTSNIDRSATKEGLANCDAISVASAKLAAYEAAQ